MQVTAATMRAAHIFEVVQQEKVASVVYQGDIGPVRRCFVYCHSDPEPQTYLHLRGGVVVMLRFLVSPVALCLGSWGGAYLRWGCCQCLAAGRCGWRLLTVWRYKPPWEGYQFRTKIPHRECPLQALEVFDLTCCRLSNAWRKLSLNPYCMRRRMAAGKLGCWQACAPSLRLNPDVSCRRRNIF